MRRAALLAAVGAMIAVAACGGGHRVQTRRHVHAHLVGVTTSRPGTAGLERFAIDRLLKLGYPIYCGGRRGHELAFTFDDGPGPYTHYALAKLAVAHQRATFFVVGKSIDSWPGWVQREVRIAALGDHSYTHPFLPFLQVAAIRDQIERTRLKIERVTGQPVYLFRPPYGAVDRAVDRVVRSLALLRIMWTLDSRDSLGANWLQIIRNVELGLHPGAIILMHENHGQTIRALPALLAALHRRDLRSVTVPELLASDPPSLAQLRRGPEGCGRLRSEVVNGG